MRSHALALPPPIAIPTAERTLSTAFGSRSSRVGLFSAAVAGLLSKRELDSEGHTFALLARKGDGATVGLHDQLRNRKAEARPRDRLLSRVRAAEEAFDYVSLLGWRDADAAVCDLERGMALLRVEAYEDASVGA